MGQHVTDAGRRQFLQCAGVALPAVIHLAGRPFGQLDRHVVIVEAPGSQPVDGSQQHIEGIVGQEARHLVHLALVVIDLEADDHRQPGILGLLGTGDVGLKVGGGVKVPVVRHRFLQLRGDPIIPPESTQERFGLAKTEKVLGHRQLHHAGRLGLLAVGRQLLNGQRRLTLVVRPEVEVVVQHSKDSAGVTDQRHAIANGGQHADDPGVVDQLVVQRP